MKLLQVKRFLLKKRKLNESRSISEIAYDIKKEWGSKVSYYAKPYLQAMYSSHSINDNYGADSARSIIAYFLSNASGFRGEKAKKLKAELKKLIK